jgi:hypothetical protein
MIEKENKTTSPIFKDQLDTVIEINRELKELSEY